MKLVHAVLGTEVKDEDSHEAWSDHCEAVEEALMQVGFDLNHPDKSRGFQVKQFLNRLLGLGTTTQNRTFKHFTAIFDDEIARDKSEGKYDDGVVDLRAGSITLKGAPIPFYTDPTTKARTTLYGISVDRGMNWDTAWAELEAANAREVQNGNRDGHINGFYEEGDPSIANGRKRQWLVIRKQYQYGHSNLNQNYEMYRILSPNWGLTFFESKMSIQQGGAIKHTVDTPAGKDKARRLWQKFFDDAKKCVHWQVRSCLRACHAALPIVLSSSVRAHLPPRRCPPPPREQRWLSGEAQSHEWRFVRTSLN